MHVHKNIFSSDLKNENLLDIYIMHLIYTYKYIHHAYKQHIFKTRSNITHYSKSSGSHPLLAPTLFARHGRCAMELACGCFKAKPKPEISISNLEQAELASNCSLWEENAGILMLYLILYGSLWGKKYGKRCGVWVKSCFFFCTLAL